MRLHIWVLMLLQPARPGAPALPADAAQVETKLADKISRHGGRMEVFRFNIIPTEEFNKREDFRKAVNNCEICGAALEFSYKQENAFAVLQEEAKCSCCDSEKEPTRHRVH
nr:hypothetical protein [uncultured Bdellovibrio sp.]